jgi:hypothetical protein
MITVTGLDGVTAALRRLERAEREFPRETRKALRDVAPELIRDVKEHAEDVLPRRGGYAREVATKTRFHVTVSRTTAGTVLTITATGPDKRLDTQGRLRHPVYADGPRSEWAWARDPQQVTPGWFSRPMKVNERHVRVVLITAGSRAIRGR